MAKIIILEQKDAKVRKKQLENQLKHEEALATAVREWNIEILPNWETAYVTLFLLSLLVMLMCATVIPNLLKNLLP